MLITFTRRCGHGIVLGPRNFKACNRLDLIRFAIYSTLFSQIRPSVSVTGMKRLLPQLYMTKGAIYSLALLCLNVTIPCVDFLYFTMGDVGLPMKLDYSGIWETFVVSESE